MLLGFFGRCNLIFAFARINAFASESELFIDRLINCLYVDGPGGAWLGNGVCK